jgi:DNA-binding CsgD family transcriptional regulator
MQDQQLVELKRISRLLALLLTKDLETQAEKIAALSGAGLSPEDVADLLGTTAQKVSVTLSNIRRGRGERSV